MEKRKARMAVPQMGGASGQAACEVFTGHFWCDGLRCAGLHRPGQRPPPGGFTCTVNRARPHPRTQGTRDVSSGEGGEPQGASDMGWGRLWVPSPAQLCREKPFRGAAGLGKEIPGSLRATARQHPPPRTRPLGVPAPDQAAQIQEPLCWLL